MKKTLRLLMLLAAVLVLGVSQAHAAVPVIDGLVGAGEWDDLGYTYYLNVLDPNEPEITPDTMDIMRVTLLQELDADFGGTETTATKTDDGVYLLIQTFVTPTTLEDPDLDPNQLPVVSLAGDFLGNGLTDPFNIFVRHFNSAQLDGVDNPAEDVVTFCLGTAAFCNPLGPNYALFTSVGPNPFGAFPAFDRTPNGYEYFFPTGLFGTPVAPFPASFIGSVRFDNGAEPADDLVVGSVNVIPEPTSMFLLGSGLLSLLGFGVRRSK